MSDNLVTLFCSPKPFVGHDGVIQTNALRNWKALGFEAILFGSDEGTAAAADAFGFTHITDVLTSSYGTPRLDDMFHKAQVHAKTPLVSYINADIMLFPAFAEAAQHISLRFDSFLMVGQRTDLDVTNDFPMDAGWQNRLEEKMAQHGVMHSPYGMDYFVFPKGAVKSMPPFMIGRQGWDGWFIWTSAKNGVPVVNTTDVNPVVHQNHDYAHVPGKTHNSWVGSPESLINLEMARSFAPDLDIAFASIFMAPWRLTDKGIRQDMTSDRLNWYSRKLLQRAAAPAAPTLNRSLKRVLPSPIYKKMRDLWRGI